MAPSPLQQRRTHNTLLFQKLLNLRDGASPFTLVLDTLEQSGAPIVGEFVRRAKIARSKILFISFSTLAKKVSFQPDIFISAYSKPLSALRTEILSHLPQSSTPSPFSNQLQKYLLIIDTLTPLASSHAPHLSPFLSSLLLSPQISLLAIYHTDIPLSRHSSPNHPQSTNEYTPSPLATIIYLATAILSIQNLSHVVARKRARDRSLQEPVFGLDEGREGVLVGLNGREGSSGNGREVVIEMELRRKSGRGIVDFFVLAPSSSSNSGRQEATIILLDEHPLYATVLPTEGVSGGVVGNEEAGTTFSLSLTEKQKRDRENVVLPYFDAQKDGGIAGPGEGGRILYEMGVEDREDFDDEEDEI